MTEIAPWITLVAVIISGLTLAHTMRKGSEDLHRIFAERISKLEALVSTFSTGMVAFEARIEHRLEQIEARLLELERERRK